MAGLHDLVFGKGASPTSLGDSLPEAQHPVLSYLLGGQSGLDSARTRSAETAAVTVSQQQRVKAMADAKQLFPDSPPLQILAAAKPDVFYSTISDYAKPQKLAKGEQVFEGGKSVAYNPDPVVMGDQLVTPQADGTAQPVYTRPQSYAETNGAAESAARLKQSQAELLESIRAHNQQYGIGAGNLHVAQQREAREGGADAGYAPPNQDQGPALAAIAAELKRRGRLP